MSESVSKLPEKVNNLILRNTASSGEKFPEGKVISLLNYREVCKKHRFRD